MSGESKKSSLIRGLLIVLSVLILWFVFYKSPLRLDDWNWGDEVGIERLQSWFDGYNGRYVGNIIVIVLLRVSPALRAIMQKAFTLGIIYYVNKIFKLVESGIGITIFGGALMLMPMTMASQTWFWVSGFANFVTSALVLLLAFYFGLRFMRGDAISWKVHAILSVFLFLGQLILETVTIYLVAFWAIIFAYSVYRSHQPMIEQRRRCSRQSMAFLIYSIVGAVIMFSNSAYSAAMGNADAGETYKQIGGEQGSWLRNAWQTYVESISADWIGMNSLLNIILVILCILLVWKIVIQNENHGKERCMLIPASCFLGIFVADLTNSGWLDYFDQLLVVKTVIYSLFYLYLWGILFLVMPEKYRLLGGMILLSELLLMGPLLVASPLNDRCYLHTYLLWAMFAGLLFQGMNLKIEAWRLSELVLGFVCVGLITHAASQAVAWKIEDQRVCAIDQAIKEHRQELILPYVPDVGRICYGANTVNGEEWNTNFKRYYQIPDNVKVSFVDYDKWVEEFYVAGEASK